MGLRMLIRNWVQQSCRARGCHMGSFSCLLWTCHSAPGYREGSMPHMGHYNSETLDWASLDFRGFCWCLLEGKCLLRGKIQTL